MFDQACSGQLFLMELRWILLTSAQAQLPGRAVLEQEKGTDLFFAPVF
ncbi:hypothetical protein [Pseudomonas sp. R1-15]